MGSSGENFAPSFTQKPKLRQEDDGNKLIFDCQLVASPKPEIDWYRGDVHVKETKRIVITIKPAAKTNTFDVQLILDDVEEEDAGLYKVKAKNKYGEVSASINLNFSRKYFLPSNIVIKYFLLSNVLIKYFLPTSVLLVDYFVYILGIEK